MYRSYQNDNAQIRQGAQKRCSGYKSTNVLASGGYTYYVCGTTSKDDTSPTNVVCTIVPTQVQMIIVQSHTNASCVVSALEVC